MGTRPEAIKLAPVILGLRHQAGQRVTVLHSGQHGELALDALSSFGLVPDASLNVLDAHQTLGNLTAKCLKSFEEFLSTENPDYLLVQGDTTTALAGAMSAFYQRIPVGHVEAGLRTYDLSSPFPEEANRQMLARIAHDHFAPTPRAREQLLAEGVNSTAIHLTGNTVVDALRLSSKREPPLQRPNFSPDLHKSVLVTMHRRENHDMLTETYGVTYSLATEFPDVDFVLVRHPNSTVTEAIDRMPSSPPNVVWIDPLPYAQFLDLLAASTVVITDSGGVQEERVSLGLPVIVARSTTERQEGVEMGLAQLIGTETDALSNAARYQLRSETAWVDVSSVYGDGFATERIVDVILASGER